MAFLNVLPKFKSSRGDNNFHELRKRYPDNGKSLNPLPVYVISSHGSIDFGVNIIFYFSNR